MNYEKIFKDDSIIKEHKLYQYNLKQLGNVVVSIYRDSTITLYFKQCTKYKILNKQIIYKIKTRDLNLRIKEM